MHVINYDSVCQRVFAYMRTFAVKLSEHHIDVAACLYI